MRRRAQAIGGALLSIALAGAPPASEAASSAADVPKGTPVRQPVMIRISDGATVITATLNDSPAAADFASMLPLSLTIADYASTEKIAYLPRKLAATGAPPGIAPKPAMLAYYAPWGNLALFYRDAAYARGLVELGRIDGSASALERLGPRKVQFERIE
jgi:hypothetical protein